MRWLVSLLILLSPSLTLAQRHTLEITPTLGFHRAGGIVIEERAFYFEDFGVGIASSGSYGILLDVPFSRSLMLELMVGGQAGAFKDRQGLFGEQPGGLVKPGTRDLLDVDLIYVHGGVAWELARGWSRPFMAGGLGVARIDPTLPLPRDIRFSMSGGGGWKLDLDERLGLRFEGRYFWTGTDNTISAVQTFEHRDCAEPCTYTYRYGSHLSQGGLSIGLVVKI